MNAAKAAVAILFLLPAVSWNAIAEPTDWTEEIPGVPDGVLTLTMAGDEGKIGVAYETSTYTGFVLRESGSWSIKSADISGNGTILTDKSLCFNGGTSWVLAGENSGQGNASVWRTNDDGATWQLSLWIPSTSWSGEVACYDNDTWGVVTITSGAAMFYRSTDSGGNWSTPFSLTDDDGSPGGSGTELTETVNAAAIAWESDSIITAVIGGETTNNGYAWKTQSDDGGLFWEAPPIQIFTSTNAATYGVDEIGLEYGGGRYALVLAEDHGQETFVNTFEGSYEDFDDVSRADHPDQPDSQSGNDHHCGSAGQTCQLSINDDGQILYAATRPNIGSAYFVEGSESSATRVISSPGSVQRALSVHIDTEVAAFAYRDSAQGDRLEVKIASVHPPPVFVSFLNPNGNNWGDVRTPFENVGSLYAKEIYDGDDSDLGNVFKFNPDLSSHSRWDACPQNQVDFLGGTSSDETVGILGGLGILTDATSDGGLILTSCLNDYTVTDEHYTLNVFTEPGQWLGGAPIYPADEIDSPLDIHPCNRDNVVVHLFQQVDPIDVASVDTFPIDTSPGSFQYRGNWVDEFTDIQAMAYDFYEGGNCRFYAISSTLGTSSISSTPENRWMDTGFNGDGIAACRGSVYAVDGSNLRIWEDQGGSAPTSATIIATEPLVTSLTFFEPLRVSHDCRYLIYHSTSDDVEILEIDSLEVVTTVTIPSGGTMRYDLSHFNDWLYVSRDNTIYGFDLSQDLVSSLNPEDCGTEFNPEGCGDDFFNQPEPTSSPTIGPGGVGGEQGGFIGEPGSGIPGLDVDGTAQQLGISTAALAWLLGIIWVAIFTVAFGTLPLLGPNGKFSTALAGVGFLVGTGSGVALSLIPVWFIAILGILGAGFLVVRLRSSN